VELSQETPLAITVLNEQALKDRQITRINDLQSAIPGFSVMSDEGDPFDSQLSLRGLSSLTSASVSVDPSVGIYIDGIYQGFNGNSLRNAYDLSSIEVDKGPQGTLYGRNTTGGAVNIIHNLPTDHFEGWVKLGVGDYGEHEVAEMINVPILPGVVDLRVVGGYYKNNGYGEVIPSGVPVPQPAVGQNLDDLRSETVHATLRLRPSEAWDIIARTYWDEGRSNGNSAQPFYMEQGGGANIEAALEQFGLPFGTALGTLSSPLCSTPAAFGANIATCRPAFGAYNADLAAARAAYLAHSGALTLKSTFDDPQLSRARSVTNSLEVNYTINDQLKIKNLVAYSAITRDSAQDFDAGPYAIGAANEDTKIDQTTEEIQLNGNLLGNKLKFTLGTFYYYMTAPRDNLTGVFLPALVPDCGACSNFKNRVHADSVAPYGQVTYALTSQINITGGLRWTDETKDLDNAFIGNNEDSFRNLSYVADIDYTPVKDLMVYLKTSRAFRSGGQQETAAVPIAFAPERVTDYELGIKSEFFDKRLRVNADIYRENYDDLQQNVEFATANGGVDVLTLNAGSATVDGAELEVTGRLTRDLTLSVQGAYIDPSYKTFVAGILGEVKGVPFANVERWSGTVAGDYTKPVPWGTMGLHLDWHWQSRQDFSAVPTIYSQATGEPFGQGPYGLMNGRLSWNIDKHGLELALWAKNMLNKRYLTYGYDGSGNTSLDGKTVVPGLGIIVGSTGDVPLTFGFEVITRFGGE
jgi:iron complex outermembrane receptor protein